MIPLSSRFWPGARSACALLVHGWGDGAWVWNAFLSHFLRERSALTVDLRGHGDSPWDPGGCYVREAHVADLLAVIDQLDQARTILIGHSLGADVAIRAAAQRPHRVRALVIVDGGPELNERAALALRDHMKSLVWRYRTVTDFAAVLAHRYPLAQQQVLEDYASSALRRVNHEWFELKADPALQRSLPAPDDVTTWAALESMSCPKLLVRGAASSFLSQRHAELVCRRAPHCRLASVPLAGHSIPLDNPAGLNEAITPFLAEVAP